MASQKFTIAEAHRITGKSRTTLSKHIGDGTLSAERNPNGKGWLVVASELIRVYDDACDFDSVASAGKKSKTASAKSNRTGEANVSTVQFQLDREKEERERERSLYKAQIENLQESLSKAQDGLNRTTLLLENQTERGGGWENALESMSLKIASEQNAARQERRELKEASLKRESKLKRALDSERKKSLWKRIFTP